MTWADRVKSEHPQQSKCVCLLRTTECPRGFRLADLVKYLDYNLPSYNLPHSFRIIVTFTITIVAIRGVIAARRGDGLKGPLFV